MHEDVVLRRVSLNLPRPDVAAVFPSVPGAERSGFETTLSLPTIEPELELLVQTVLQDQSRVSLALFARASAGMNTMMKNRHACRTILSP